MARRAKRLLSLLLALMMCVSLLPATALAEGEDEAAGTIRLADAPDGENGAIATAPEKSDPEALPEEAAAGDIPIDEAHFPDKAFRAYVSENLDTDGDGALSETERAAVTSIEVSDKGMEDLTGIEYFPAVTYLNCRGNNLPALNVSSIPDLTYLDCSFNSLAELDVRANTALADLNCSVNALAELDVSANTALTVLDCSSNHLTSLDVSANTALRALYCSDNSLAELDVSANTSLQQLSCKSNGLAALYVHANTKLRNLYCYNTQITALDISSNEALASAFLTGTRTEEETDGGFIRYNSVKGELAVDATVSVITEAAPQVIASGECGDDLTWTLSDDGVLTISGTGDMQDWGLFDYRTDWFQYRDQVTSVVIEPGVTSIGSYAFNGCENVRSIQIPDTVTRIGDSAIRNHEQMTSITIPKNVSYIGSEMFYYCLSLTEIRVAEDNQYYTDRDGVLYDQSMTKLICCPCGKSGDFTIPDGVTEVGDYAFCFTGVTSVQIPESVTSIGYRALGLCSELERIDAAEGNTSFATFDGILFDKGMNTLLFCPAAKTGTVQIPAGVTGIGDSAFLYCSSTGVEIPDSVTWIGGSAFSGAQIASVRIPAGVTVISNDCFSNCLSLSAVSLPETVTAIGKEAFFGCNALSSIWIPAGVTEIGSYAFGFDSGLKEIHFLGSAPALGDSAFQDDKITAYYLANDDTWTEDVRQGYGGEVSWVPVMASGACGENLTWILDTNGTLTISGTGDMWNFASSDGGNAAVPTRGTRGEQEEAPWAAYRDQIRKVVVEEGVTSIGDHAFQACESLSQVVFEGDAPEIGEGAFEGVEATVSYPEENETWTEEVLQDYGGDLSWEPYQAGLEVIASGQCGDDLTWTLTDDYTLTITGTGDMWDFPWNNETQRGDTPWAVYTTQICRLVVEEGVTSIGREAFEPCSSLNDVELPDTLIRLGIYCFAGAAFSKISLPASLETIEYGAFSGCQNLTDAYYDGTMDQWGQISIHSENSCLQRATIHCSDGNIDNSNKCGDDLTWSFDEETGTLTITGVGDMWSSPTPWDELKPQITRIELSEDLTSIGNWVFENCTALTSLELPANVASIGAGAFYGCTALTDIVLPKKLEQIGYSAFEACSSLTAIVIPAFVTWIGDYAFSACSGLKEITFEGSAPRIEESAFGDVTATANYPSNYPGWTEDVLQNYDGELTWVAYEKEPSVLASGVCGDDLTWTLTDDGVLTISGTGDMYNYEWEAPPWSSYRSMITTVLLPDGLTGIGDSAFTDCSSLADIEIPAGVTYIGYSAFFSCQKLPSVTIPAGVTMIHSDTFAYCSSLTSITIPASVTEIEPYAFNSSGLTEITFEGCAPTIWGDIFENVTATANYPSNYPGWTEDVLQGYGGSITWVPYEKEAAVLDEGKCGDKLTWKLMDDGTMTISGTGDMWDFVYGGEGDEVAPWVQFEAEIRRLVVDEGVTGIGNEAFYTCGRLAAVELPATLVSVGDYAFDECGALTDVVFGGTIAQWEQIAIGTYNDPLTRAAIHCTDGDVDHSGKCGRDLTWSLDENGTLTVTGTGEMWDYYNTAAPWAEQRDQIRKVVLEPGVTSVSRSAFWGCPNLTEIVLPEGLTYLGQFCFRECPGLVTVDLPASLVTMDQGEFSECPNLVAINAAPGGEYKTVGGVLFTADMKTLVAYPNGLNGVNGVYQVPDGVTTLGPRAFYGGAKLTEIKLPASVVEFGYNEFQRCYKLEAVNIPEGVQMLFVSTFNDCTSLKSLTIPASVTLITDYAFCNCTSLKEIRFEGSAPEIEWWGDGTGLFQNVTATAYYPGDDASWTAQVRNSLGQGGDITWVPYEPLHGREGGQVLL